MRTLSASALFVLAACLAAPGFAAAPPAPTTERDVLGEPLPALAVARLGTSRFRPAGFYEEGVTLSPDGKLIAALKLYGARRQIALLDPTTGRVVRALAAKRANPQTLQFSADGKQVVVASTDSVVRFYDVSQGKQTRRLKTIQKAGALALSADGAILAATERAFRASKAPVLVVEVKTGRQLAAFDPAHSGEEIGLALSPDGKYLATYGTAYARDGDAYEKQQKIMRSVSVYDAATGKTHRTLETGISGYRVSAVAFSPDNKTMAVASPGELSLWDLVSGKRLKSWRGPAQAGSLSYSPDGQLLALWSRPDATFAVWDVTTGRRLRAATAPPCAVRGIGFRSGRVIALGVRSQSQVVWDVLSGKRYDSDAGQSAPVHAIGFHDRQLRTASSDGRVLTWQRNGKLVGAVPAPRDQSGHAHDAGTAGRPVFSPDGKRLAVAVCGDEPRPSVRVLRADSGEELLLLTPSPTSSPAWPSIPPASAWRYRWANGPIYRPPSCSSGGWTRTSGTRRSSTSSLNWRTRTMTAGSSRWPFRPTARCWRPAISKSFVCSTP